MIASQQPYCNRTFTSTQVMRVAQEILERHGQDGLDRRSLRLILAAGALLIGNARSIHHADHSRAGGAPYRPTDPG